MFVFKTTADVMSVEISASPKLKTVNDKAGAVLWFFNLLRQKEKSPGLSALVQGGLYDLPVHRGPE